MKSSKDILKNNSGFTLIEILLVVAIIAILVTMAIPQITGTRHSSYELSAMRALKATMRTSAMPGGRSPAVGSLPPLTR